jgi:hypothetical protein
LRPRSSPPHTIPGAALLFAAVLCLFSPARLWAQREDSLAANRVFSYAFEHKLVQKPMGMIVAEIGRQFLDAPYEGHTLDRPPVETLVTNLHSFDCVTYVENVLALARAVKSNRLTFAAYRDELMRMRYRGGKLDGYPSRLHYFSEWISDNDGKGIVQDVTAAAGGSDQQKTLNFMTGHRKSYPHLAVDSNFTAMMSAEKKLSAGHLHILAVKDIRAAQQAIREGDIIAVATSIPGLDVTHTGIAVRDAGGEVFLMHAPDEGGKVHVAAEPLWKYLQKNPKNAGIIVARPVDFSD